MSTEKKIKYTHDFSPVEKYIASALNSGCRPEVIVLYIWEPKLGGSCGKTREDIERGVYITVLDTKTGEVTMAEGPSHNNKNAAYPNYPEDAKSFWKPVLDGLRDCFNSCELKDSMVTFGIFKDGARPGVATVNYLKEIAPYALWTDQNHGSPKMMHSVKVGYDTTVWNARWPVDPSLERKYGWQRDRIVAYFARDMFRRVFSLQLAKSRLLGEMNITGEQRGFGRVAADFWPVIDGKKGKKRAIAARYPKSDWVQLNIKPSVSYLAPGPDGAIGTIRLEMMREGVQECEARIFIEKALLDKNQRAKLGNALSVKLEALLDARTRMILSTLFSSTSGSSKGNLGAEWYSSSEWQNMSKDLYEAATRVDVALKK